VFADSVAVRRQSVPTIGGPITSDSRRRWRFPASSRVRACQAGRDPLTSDDDRRSTDGVTIEFSRVVRIGDVAKRPCPGAPQRAAW